MKILHAAQQILIERTVNVFVDMRENCDTSEEYRDHFGQMGEMIAKIEGYTSFGKICDDIEGEVFGQIGLVGDEEEMETFISDVKKYMEKYSK